MESGDWVARQSHRERQMEIDWLQVEEKTIDGVFTNLNSP
jgi:hypothetical protein